MNRIAFIIAVSLFAFSQGRAQAPASDPQPEAELVPTVVEAERGRSETKDGLTYLIFSGSVKLTATNLDLSCNQLEIFARTQEEEGDEPALGDFSAIEKIVATGAVRIVQDQRTATAGRMEALPNEDVIILEDDPIVYQGAATIDGTGAQLIIRRGEGRIEMIGDAENKVRISAAPIQDFGYEKDEETIIPEEENADPESTESKPENGDDTQTDDQ